MTEQSVQPAQAAETPNVDPDLLEDIIESIDERDTRWLARTLQRMHPADAADALEALSFDTFSEAVELLGGELPADILIELRDSYREEAVEVLPDAAVASALDELDSDDATTILEDLEDDRRERILKTSRRLTGLSLSVVFPMKRNRLAVSCRRNLSLRRNIGRWATLSTMRAISARNCPKSSMSFTLSTPVTA